MAVTGAERMARYRLANREKYLERHRRHAAKRRAKPGWKRYKKDHDLKGKYGITIEQFEAMAAEQNGTCPICTKPLDMGFRTHVDHCHKTGNVRGLLCSGCNAAIGGLGDDVDTLERAISYLRGARNKCQ